MTTLLLIHSIVRWIIVLIAIAAIVKFAWGWLQKTTFRPVDRGLMAGFTGLIDLQLVLGLILLVWMGQYTRHQLEHTFTMIIVLLMVHLLPRRWRGSPDAIRFRNNLAVILAAIALIVLGVIVLPGSRWAL